jgi:hypothetical protein
VDGVTDEEQRDRNADCDPCEVLFQKTAERLLRP